MNLKIIILIDQTNFVVIRFTPTITNNDLHKHFLDDRSFVMFFYFIILLISMSVLNNY